MAERAFQDFFPFQFDPSFVSLPQPGLALGCIDRVMALTLFQARQMAY